MKTLEEFRKKYISVSAESDKDNGRSEFIGSVFFAFISLLLTLVNIVKQVSPAMTIATSALLLGFCLSAVLSRMKKLIAARVLILIFCGITFSMFAVSGGNDGFAILWIVLVPIIGSIWVGLKSGVIMSIYFQVFLMVLFYTPLSEYVKDYYSQTFMLRFPLLYLASFGSVTILMWQREDLLNKLHIASYYDALTGLHNRRYYNEQTDRLRKNESLHRLVVFSFDLNSLKQANDTFGHQAGDELLKASADIIKRNFKGAECFRTGGDEFMAYASNIDPQKAIAAMNADCCKWHGEYMKSISISVGYACALENPQMGFDELSTLADKRMYADKADYYRTNGIDRRGTNAR